MQSCSEHVGTPDFPHIECGKQQARAEDGNLRQKVHRREARQAHSGKLSARLATSARKASSATGTVASSRPSLPRRAGVGLRSPPPPHSPLGAAALPLAAEWAALPPRAAAPAVVSATRGGRGAASVEPGRGLNFAEARPMPAALLGLYTAGFFTGLTW